jgi:serine/threonine protein kinase
MCRSVILPKIQSPEVMHDSSGNIVASQGLQVCAPWVVFASKKFDGRYFFLNSETNQSVWSLPPNYIITPSTAEPQPSKVEALPVICEAARAAACAANENDQWSSINWNSIDVEVAPKKVDGPLFMVLDGLGRGGYASVVKVEHLVNKKTFAMKVVAKNVSSSESKRLAHQAQLKNELKFMTQIPPSPFLQQCHYAFESPSAVFFVLDLISGGDLFYHLVKRVSAGLMFSEQEARVMLSELYLAVEHLHQQGVVHRDIKIENIMLDHRGHIKLVDYGLAVEIEEEVQPMSAMGSLIYMAPELVRDRTGGRHTDWWAFGVLAHELLTGNTPWSSLTDSKVIKKEIQSSVIVPLVGVSQAASKFVLSLMCRDVSQRLGTKADSDVKKSSFFKSIDWEKTSRKESAPAFVPDCINVNKEDQDAALQSYFNMIEEKNIRNGWTLDLEDASNYLF